MPSQFKLPWYKSLVKGDVEWMDGAISTVQDKKKQKNKIKKIEKIKTKQGSHGFKREKKIMIVFGEKKLQLFQIADLHTLMKLIIFLNVLTF